MKIITRIPEMDENARSILEHISTGKLPTIAKRAQKITDQVFQKHGLLDIGVPAMRKRRGELPE